MTSRRLVRSGPTLSSSLYTGMTTDKATVERARSDGAGAVAVSGAHALFSPAVRRSPRVRLRALR